MTAVKQIVKHKRVNYPKPEKSVVIEEPQVEEVITPVEKEEKKTSNNKKKKKEKDMVNEKVNIAEKIADRLDDNKVKYVKKDKGLIERTESSKIILTEDNRQVLND